jgi:hypothetical protein
VYQSKIHEVMARGGEHEEQMVSLHPFSFRKEVQRRDAVDDPKRSASRVPFSDRKSWS